MWKKKLSLDEKKAKIKKALRKKRLLYPSRKELVDAEGVLRFCQGQELSPDATQRAVNLVTGVVNDVDWRDHRKLPMKERVPRSLEEWCPPTPPHYWDIDL
jgi:hypothetical protein